MELLPDKVFSPKIPPGTATVQEMVALFVEVVKFTGLVKLPEQRL